MGELLLYASPTGRLAQQVSKDKRSVYNFAAVGGPDRVYTGIGSEPARNAPLHLQEPKTAITWPVARHRDADCIWG